MRIPLTIGFSSMQKPFNIDLTSISHLFVSYTEDEQLINLFEDYCTQLKSREDEGLRFAMAVHSKNKNRLLNILPAYQWIRILNSNNGVEEKNDNKALFIKDVYSELNKRMKNIKKDPTPLPLIIFCDDIIDLGIRNATKQISRQFLLLLAVGTILNLSRVSLIKLTGCAFREKEVAAYSCTTCSGVVITGRVIFSSTASGEGWFLNTV